MIQVGTVQVISIHTPLAGSDYQHPHPNRHTHDISIHALHEESDPKSFPATARHANFNPRSP